MRLTHVELHELALPLSEPFIISGGTMTVRRSLVVVLHDDAGHVGYGESPPFELPFYSEETLASARHLILAHDRNVVLGLARHRARIAADARVQIDSHAPLVALRVVVIPEDRERLRLPFSGEVRLLSIAIERRLAHEGTAFHRVVFLRARKLVLLTRLPDGGAAVEVRIRSRP
jgi:hypothetical protein